MLRVKSKLGAGFRKMTIDIRVVAGMELFHSCLSKDKQMITEPFRDLKYFITSEFEKETHIVAYDGDRVVGNIALQVNPYDKNSMWLMQIAVLPIYQRNGIAALMINCLMDKMKRDGKALEVSSFTEEGENLRDVFERMSDEYGVRCIYNN